jgi:Tfp pilus assembly protein PilF
VRRGDLRKALLTMRAACYEDGDDPKLWAMYGHYAQLSGKSDEAREAFAHAVWLFERRHEDGRASALRNHAARLERADCAA